MRDLREYAEALEKAGELHRIEKQVDWNLEAGAVASWANTTGAPAPFFLKVKDYPGYSLLANPLSGSRVRGNRHWRRFAIALGLDPGASFMETVDEYLKRRSFPIKPLLVSTGPCKENIKEGKELDLFSLPIPLIHEIDGGRYSSWHVNICEDPESEWVNWGLYRWVVHTRDMLGVKLIPGQHAAMLYYEKYEARDQSMPFCIAIGGDPLLTVAASIGAPAGVSECDIAGGLRREPVALVKAETVDLYVPAQAEVIIEGKVYPHERLEEGPFGEYHAYAQAPLPAPVCRVTAITHRDNPIFPFSASGAPMDDYAATMSVVHSAELLHTLRDKDGWPVRAVFCPPEAIDHLLIVSCKMVLPNMSRLLAGAIWRTKIGMAYDKIIVCDDLVDPANREMVWWALSHKLHPHRGIRKFAAPGHPLQPFLTPEERVKGVGAQVYFDCTFPLDWDPETELMKLASFKTIYPPEIQEKVLTRWGPEYGYDRDVWEV